MHLQVVLPDESPDVAFAEWRDAGADELAIWFGTVDGFGARMTTTMRS